MATDAGYKPTLSIDSSIPSMNISLYRNYLSTPQSDVLNIIPEFEMQDTLAVFADSTVLVNDTVFLVNDPVALVGGSDLPTSDLDISGIIGDVKPSIFKVGN